jgi:hypothetical protein
MPGENAHRAAKLWVGTFAALSLATSAGAASPQQIWRYHCSYPSGNFTFDIVMDIATGTISDNGQAFINGENLNQCIARVTWETQKASWGHSCNDGTIVVDSLDYPSGVYRHHARGPVALSDSIAYCDAASLGKTASPFGWFRRIFVH